MIVVIVAVKVGSMFSTVSFKYKSSSYVGTVGLIYVVSCFLVFQQQSLRLRVKSFPFKYGIVFIFSAFLPSYIHEQQRQTNKQRSANIPRKGKY